VERLWVEPLWGHHPCNDLGHRRRLLANPSVPRWDRRHLHLRICQLCEGAGPRVPCPRSFPTRWRPTAPVALLRHLRLPAAVVPRRQEAIAAAAAVLLSLLPGRRHLAAILRELGRESEASEGCGSQCRASLVWKPIVERSSLHAERSSVFLGARHRHQMLLPVSRSRFGNSRLSEAAC